MIEQAGGVEGYEFQRLHGMGEVLYEELLAEAPGAACRVYAPVGSHRDLLAYLVRRLLENGANSSFVAVAADPTVPVEDDPASGRRPGSAMRSTRGIRTSRCRAISIGRRGRIRRASSSAIARRWRRCSATSKRAAPRMRALRR